MQRVPDTETKGRIHTSAATVAVLPEPEDVEVSISPEDYRKDMFCASGPGGQHVNKTASAVRLTHLATGIVVQCQDEKSQHKNLAKALRVLKTRLYEHERQIEHDKRSSERKGLVGSGDRSQRIRTYNFPQNRVTDHRINENFTLDQVMAGRLGLVIDAIERHARDARRQEMAPARPGGRLRPADAPLPEPFPAQRRSRGASMSDDDWTVGRLLSWTTGWLGERGSESPRLDAEVLLAHVRGCQRILLYTAFAEVVPDEERARFRDLVRRRGQGEPVAYLVGSREFFSLPLMVSSAVLVPRPETEGLVVRVLDLCRHAGGGPDHRRRHRQRGDCRDAGQAPAGGSNHGHRYLRRGIGGRPWERRPAWTG